MEGSVNCGRRASGWVGGGYLVGTAMASITPPPGTELVGQFQPRFAQGVHDDLYLRALVISDGARALALVSCDLATVSGVDVAAARVRIATTSGIPAGNCHVFATHCHTGPGGVSQFPERLVRLVAQAMSTLRPVTIVGTCATVDATFNRRFLLRDGQAVTHPKPGREDVVGSEGPADPELGVLAALGADGRWVGAVLNWACHPITVGHESLVSADFPGAAEAFLRAAGQPGVVCLFANGAAGNLCPFDWDNPERTPYGFAYMHRLGGALGAAALQAVEREVASGRAAEGERRAPRVNSRTRRVALPLRSLNDIARTTLSPGSEAEGRALMAEREVLRARLQASPTEELELSAAALGEARLLFQPAELFCEFGRQIKSGVAGLPTMVVGYAGDCVGYIPTEEAFAHGGYETHYWRMSRFAPETGQLIVQAAVALATGL